MRPGTIKPRGYNTARHGPPSGAQRPPWRADRCYGGRREGTGTMLSVRSALLYLPMVAALSANHVAELLFGVTLQRQRRRW